MKTNSFTNSIFFILLITSQIIFSQELRYVALSNNIIGKTEKGKISLESSINIKTEPKFEIAYSVSDKITLFGSYNFIKWRNKRYSFLKGLFGGPGYDYVENNNSGYSFGLAYIKYNESKSKNLEFLVGYEKQCLDIIEYYPLSPNQKDYIQQKYYKLFLQFNYVKLKGRFDMGYTLKLSYYRITELYTYLYDSSSFSTTFINSIPEKKGLPIIDANYSMNYKMIKTTPLFVTFQVGVSASLDSSNGINLFGIITKVGLKYKFDL